MYIVVMVEFGLVHKISPTHDSISGSNIMHYTCIHLGRVPEEESRLGSVVH